MLIDDDFVADVKPHEASPETRAFADGISATDFSIYTTRLELWCEEGNDTMVKVGLAPTLQAHDCCVGIYTREGDLAVAATSTFLHLATGVVPIRHALAKFVDDPSVGCNDGDMFFCNDPLWGGIHNPDQICFTPIVFDGEIVAWVLAASHETDTGAIKPASFVPEAKTRFEEGLRLPPVKIGEDFRLKQDMLDAIANQLWAPFSVIGDTKIKASAALNVRDKLMGLMEERGKGFLIGLLRRSVEAAEQGARQRVSELADGTYRSTAFLDRRGLEEGLVGIHVRLEKRGDTVHAMIEGASPPSASYLNTRPHIIRAVLIGNLAVTLFADLPASTGLFAPFEISVPEQTIAYPPPEAALTGSLRITPLIVDTMVSCLNRIVYASQYRERIVSSVSNSGQVPFGAGVDQYGRSTAWTSQALINGHGIGARTWRDGEDAVVLYFCAFVDSGDVESEEVHYPVLHLYRTLGLDQAGFGKFRGGASASMGTVFYDAASPFTVTFGPANSRTTCGTGLFGGYSSGVSPAVALRGVDWDDVFANGHDTLPVSYHDLLERRSIPGEYVIEPALSNEPAEALFVMLYAAGGYGDVLEREPDAVAHDVRRGVFSDATARDVFGVILERDTGWVDEYATAAARDDLRTARRQRGRSFAEFERSWSSRQPTDGQLAHYGPWPQGIELESDVAKEQPTTKAVVRVADDLEDGTRMPVAESLSLDLREHHWHCRRCGHDLGDATTNYKESTLVAERDPAEVHPAYIEGEFTLAPDGDWVRLIEFYCPGCLVMMDVEYLPPGHPITHDIEIALDTLPVIESEPARTEVLS